MLTVPKGEGSRKKSEHSLLTSDNSIEIDISDGSKNRCQEIMKRARKREVGESCTGHMEKCMSIDTSDDSTSRRQTKILRTQCEHDVIPAEVSNNDDVGTGVEVTVQSHRMVLTVIQENISQIKPNRCPDHDHRHVDNIDASKSRQMNQENCVSKESSDCKENRQGVCLLTLKKSTLDIDSCEESRRRSNRCNEPITVNIHDNNKCLALNKCVVTKQYPTLMGNQWLSNDFSRFTSSVLRKNNEGKVDNINADPNSNLTSSVKPEFNFFL